MTPLEIIKYILIAYLVLWIRYVFFVFPNDNTLHIESRNVPIRYDELLTLYENPSTDSKTGNSLSEKRLHRYFSSKTLRCSLPDTEQTHIFIFSPNQTEFLYTSFFYVNVLKRKQISFIDVNKPDLKKFPLYKNSIYTEIPISGKQTVYIPRGWWIFTNNPENFIIK